MQFSVKIGQIVGWGAPHLWGWCPLLPCPRLGNPGLAAEGYGSYSIISIYNVSLCIVWLWDINKCIQNKFQSL